MLAKDLKFPIQRCLIKKLECVEYCRKIIHVTTHSQRIAGTWWVSESREQHEFDNASWGHCALRSVLFFASLQQSVSNTDGGALVSNVSPAAAAPGCRLVPSAPIKMEQAATPLPQMQPYQLQLTQVLCESAWRVLKLQFAARISSTSLCAHSRADASSNAKSSWRAHDAPSTCAGMYKRVFYTK